jgi:nitrogen-specific signal transduction histidine kinase
MLLPAAGLTAVALLIVQRSVESRVRHNHPFVSHGKGSGTWSGLTIAQKIVSDHSGEFQVEQPLPGCTMMRIGLPS